MSFLVLAIAVNAQESKWQLSIVNSYDFVKGELQYGSDVDSQIFYSRIRQTNNFTAGIEVNRLISDRWTVSSGLLFSNKTSGKILNCPVCNDDSNDFVISGSGLKEPLHYLILPITAGYALTQTKFRPIVRAGFVSNLLVTSEFTEGRRFVTDWLAGIDLQYVASSSVSVLLGLQIRGATTTLFKKPIDQGGLPNGTSTTDSIRLGISYSL